MAERDERRGKLTSIMHPLSAQAQCLMPYRQYLMNPDNDPMKKGYLSLF